MRLDVEVKALKIALTAHPMPVLVHKDHVIVILAMVELVALDMSVTVILNVTSVPAQAVATVPSASKTLFSILTMNVHVRPGGQENPVSTTSEHVTLFVMNAMDQESMTAIPAAPTLTRTAKANVNAR